MRLATVKQSQEIDELAQKVYGLSGDVLMESAGCLSAREIELAYFPEINRGQFSVVCGPGNNGGDGLVVARHLHASGHRDLTVYLLAPKRTRSALFNLQLERASKQGLRIIDLEKQPEKKNSLLSSHLIIDALFGIGLKKNLEGEFLKLVDLVNSSKVPVVSLDCPSGLNCDTGRVEGQAVKAAMTLTFGLAKPGFFVGEGPQYVGKLRVLSIGFPYEALRGTSTTHFLFTDKLARRYLPKRKESSNKSDHGHLLVLAGREGFWGAGILSSASAYRMGAGYVTWGSFTSPKDEIKSIPEVLTAEIHSVQDLIGKKYSAVAIGPGLGVNQKTADLIKALKKMDIPVVVDADAITTCVQFDLFPLPKSWIMTPHTGELAKVLKIDSRKIEENRFDWALKAAHHCGCYILLKGFRSVLAYGERCMVINSGNAALAKAGTGDVLTGMIGALLAQNVDVLQAAATAAYIHGRMSDEWVRVGNDKRSLMASDLSAHLPQLISRISGGTLV